MLLRALDLAEALREVSESGLDCIAADFDLPDKDGTRFSKPFGLPIQISQLFFLRGVTRRPRERGPLKGPTDSLQNGGD